MKKILLTLGLMIEQSRRERKLVLDKIFPPLVLEEYRMLDSLLELWRVWIFDGLYSVLYRMSVVW